MKTTSKTVYFLLFLAYSLICVPVQADSALGFGWNNASLQEDILSIDLETGSVTRVGSIPGLSNLSLGSFTFDRTTQSAAVLGSSDSQKLFLIDSQQKTALTFILPETAGITYQDSLFNPVDGNLYVLAYDANVPANKVYRVNLVPGTSTVKIATAELELVVTLSLSSYRTGSPVIEKSGSKGVFSLLEDGDTLTRIDLETLDSESLSLGATQQSDFYCSDSSSYYGISYPVDHNVFSSIDAAGTVTPLADANSIKSWTPGSQVCTANELLVLGKDNSDNSTVFRVSRQTGDVNETVLNANDVTVLFPLATASALQETFDSASAKALSAKSKTKKVKYKVVSASAIGRCAKKNVRLRSANTMQSFIQAARLAKLQASQCRKY